MAGPVGGHNPYIMSFQVRGKQDMKYFAGRSCQYQIAGEVLVCRVFLNDFVTLDSIKNGLRGMNAL